MKDTPYNVASTANELVAFSPIALRLCEIIDDKYSSSKSIGFVIQQDAALSTSILKLANSAFYGFSQEIGAIDEAVSRIGTREIYRMALSVSAAKSFTNIPSTLITMEDFWSHSLLCAFSAQELAQEIQMKPSGAIYAAGLLHDIGQLVLYANRPEKSTEVLEICMNSFDVKDQSIVENEVFGFNHQQVGAELATLWNFPGLLKACIEFHHAPGCAQTYKQEALLIHAANIFSVLIEIESDDLDDAPPMNAQIAKLFVNDTKKVQTICTRIKKKYLDNKRIFLDAMV
ncbi:MAG: HDOD domain-containing protein [Gammaproteobacteria bacterium]